MPCPIPPEVLIQLTDNEMSAIKIVSEIGRVTTSLLFERIGIPKRSAARLLRNLSERNLLVWHGSSKTDPSQYYDFGNEA